jgi:hypothetical protein
MMRVQTSRLLMILLSSLAACSSTPKPGPTPEVTAKLDQVRAEQDKAMEVPFALNKKIEALAAFPDDFWNSTYQFSSIRSADTDGSIEQSSADGRLTTRMLNENQVHLIFFIDSSIRSEKLKDLPEHFIVTHKQSALVFDQMKLQLTLDLKSKQTTDKNGFEAVLKKIQKHYKGKPQEDFLEGVLNSIAEDPSAYFNLGPFAIKDLISHHPHEHWGTTLDQSFAGWTQKNGQNFAVFTSATGGAQPLKLEASLEPSQMSGSFGVNSWLIIRSDWKQLHSQFQIHQSVVDLNSKHEVSGTSTIANTLEAI